MGQRRYSSKDWIFESRFSFKVKQHGQRQLYLQCNVCWILYKMVSAPSFSRPYLFIQPTLQSPPKSRSSTSVNFHYPLWTLLVYKIILAISTDIPFLYISVVFHLPVLVQLSQQSKPKIFSLPQPFRQFRLNQGTNELGSLVRAGNVLIPSFFLKVRAQTHWFLLAQT